MSVQAIVCPHCRGHFTGPLAGQVGCPHCRQWVILQAPAPQPLAPIPQPERNPFALDDGPADYEEDYSPAPRRRSGNTQAVQVNVTNVIHQQKSFPHLLHAVLTFFTLGLWLPIWILHYLLSR